MRKFYFLICVFISGILFCQNLVWQQTVTDANATVAIGVPAFGSSIPTLNGEELPSGSLIGTFFIDDDGQYVSSGIIVWQGVGTTMPAYGTEAGLDNGFAIDEEFNFFARVCDGDCWTDIYVEGDDPNNPIIDWNEITLVFFGFPFSGSRPLVCSFFCFSIHIYIF